MKPRPEKTYAFILDTPDYRLSNNWRKRPESRPEAIALATQDIAKRRNIDCDAVRQYLIANPNHASWQKPYRPGSEEFHPTLILGVRLFKPGSPNDFELALVEIIPAREMRNNSAEKLAWNFLDGRWPVNDDETLAEYNILTGEALRQAAKQGLLVNLLVRRAIILGSDWKKGCRRPNSWHNLSIEKIAQIIKKLTA
jgi:hypothetical protein